MTEQDSTMKVRFNTLLDKGGRESAFVEFEGPVKNVQRDVVGYFGLAPESIDDSPSSTILGAAQKWKQIHAVFEAGDEHQQAANNVLNVFPGAQVVTPTGGNTGTPNAARVVDEAQSHPHAEYVRALTSPMSAADMGKVGVQYGKLPDHDPDLLERLRERYKELALAEKAAAKG